MRWGRLLALLGLTTLAGAVLLVAAWAIDGRVHDGEMAVNATLAGRRIRGMSPQELAAAVHETAVRYSSATITVQTPEASFQAGGAELGLSVDEARTVAAALSAGRGGALPARIGRWAFSFVSPKTVTVAIEIDERAIQRVVAERDPTREPPAEPFISGHDNGVAVVAGRPGRGVRPATLAEELARANLRKDPVVVEVARESVPPRFSEADAQALADQVEARARAGLQVKAGSATTAVPAAKVHTWARAEPTEEGLRLAVHRDLVEEDLAPLLPQAGTPAVDAGFTVQGGRVVITPSRPGTACCAPESAGAIEAALANPAPTIDPVPLELRPVPPRRDEASARSLGIVEPVGTFTTNHPGGEPRVTNIHLIADKVRGTIIGPGETFSVNATVGPRTAEKGFVEAPVIEGENRFGASVGGGVSQFATTLFNAAFFAGLEIPQYQSHLLYISRYPYGREATLSYPGPDLKIRNPSPHAVLVWPTYTDKSITVTLYSTKWAEADQTGQTKAQVGPCTSVTTERTRRFVADGSTAVDKFFARYAPEEGVICS